jgi:hypothetical protein
MNQNILWAVGYDHLNLGHFYVAEIRLSTTIPSPHDLITGVRQHSILTAPLSFRFR